MDLLVAALVARFLRRLAAAAATTGSGVRRRKRGDDPWPGRLFDPLQPEVPGEGGPPPPGGDGPVPGDPGENDIVPPDEPHDPPGFDIPDNSNDDPPDFPFDDPDETKHHSAGSVVVQNLTDPGDDADQAAAVFGQLSRSEAVNDHPKDDLQPLVGRVGTIADDWTVLRGTFTAPDTATLKVTANASANPFACALWKRWSRYTSAQITCTIYDNTRIFGLWMAAADDGTGKVNGYNAYFSGGLLQVYRYVSNVGTMLATVAAGAVTNGSTLALVRRGNTIAARIVGGAIASATDSTYTSPGGAGVGGGPAQTVNGEYRDITISQATAA